jgi:hypothetical protein
VKDSKRKERSDPIVQASDALNPPNPNFPTFFEVINNEVVIVDSKKDIREIKIASYVFWKKISLKRAISFLLPTAKVIPLVFKRQVRIT